jgi:menaquinone-dependent protoporphyrinogen oxidase
MNIALYYATREGQTRRIAEHIAAQLANEGLTCTPVDVRTLRDPVSLDGFDAVVLAASIHLGRHEREMVRFIARNREALARLPTAFLSVSGSEAAAEAPWTAPAIRAELTQQVQLAIEKLERETGWCPTAVLPVAGAIRFSKYNFLVRWVMRRIARKEGMPDDRDGEYTNWAALDRFVDAFVDGNV